MSAELSTEPNMKQNKLKEYLMKIMLWITCFLLISSTCFLARANASPSFICHQSYALCTTAPCTSVPGTKNKSICSCVVKDGVSLGQLPCDKRKLTTNNKGQQLLTSNFSFENSATNKVMTCTGNHPWTDCLDKPCIIDPINSNQAICTCDIKYSESFLTFGGQCTTETCGTTLYSGASIEMFSQGTQALVKTLNLTKSPMKNCPR